MGTLVSEKRKNDEQDSFHERLTIPWWLILLVGFALGIVFTLSMSMGRDGTVTVYSSEGISGDHAAQATLFVAEATRNAQAAQNELALSEVDSLQATATAIVSQATLQAAGSS